jgi:peptidoglycan glycosyltransferase
MERRIRRLGIFMVLCFLALFVQLNNIQVLKANSLANSPNNPRILALQRSQTRGSILSSDGVALAYSVLAPKGSYYKYQRVYDPYTATLFAQTVGFDSLIYGNYRGVEAQYNSFLTPHTRPAAEDAARPPRQPNGGGQRDADHGFEVADPGGRGTGPARFRRARSGRWCSTPRLVPSRPCTPIPTYDPNPLASTNAAEVEAAYNALDPSSAESPLVSRTFQFGFSPGSTFKAVTSSAVYDHDPPLADKDYPPVSCITVAQRVSPICNSGHESCGGTIEVSLPHSCDTAFAQLGMALGPQSMNAEAQAFGFNQNIPIDLPGAGVSTFPSVAALTNDDPLLATSAFGQGFGLNTVIATPLQMALVAAGIANQGVIMTPHVMEQIRDDQGDLVTSYSPKPWLAATNPLTASAVTSLMQKVVSEPGATAYGVFPAAWNVAAKTGTAETGGGVLGNSMTNDWMIAFAPANDPKVAVAVVVPNQPYSATGAEVSGPPTKAILGDALGPTP